MDFREIGFQKFFNNYGHGLFEKIVREIWNAGYDEGWRDKHSKNIKESPKNILFVFEPSRECIDLIKDSLIDNVVSVNDHEVVLNNGTVFLVHNPSTVLRNPLVLSEIDLFYDGSCAECQIKDQIEITNKVDENIPLISRELSYPYMIEHGGKLHLVYTYGRVKIEYITIEI